MTDESDDVVAIWRLQSRYADVITRRAWPELTQLFRPDTTIHIDTVTADPRTIVGPEAFASSVSAAIERFDHFAFVILNTVVDLGPGPHTARGRIFMCEIRHDSLTDTWPTAHGVYQDRYVKVDGRWWFEERHYRSMARQGPDATILGLPHGFTWPPGWD